MSFVLLKSFTNYVDANIALGVLQQEGINCHLEDENIVTLINMASGIRLMVHHSQLERARAILAGPERKIVCPRCGNDAVEMMKPEEGAGGKARLSIFTLISALFAANRPHRIHYRCLNCGRGFEHSS